MRNVLYVDMPDFPVEIERVLDPSLRGRPVLVASAGSRSRIVCSSAEARTSGVENGMFTDRARGFCRQAVVLPPSYRVYKRFTSAIFDVIKQYSPVIEPVGQGSMYVDLTGTELLFGPPRDIAGGIARSIRTELGLRPGMGLAVNKTTAMVAAGIEAEGLIDVFAGNEADFLFPLDVRLLPGAKRLDQEILEELNVHMIRQFAMIGAGLLFSVFGRQGPILRERALGRDPRPVKVPLRKPAIVEEKMLVPDTGNHDEINEHLHDLCEICAYRLRQSKRCSSRVSVRIWYCDSIHASGGEMLKPPSCDEKDIFNVSRRVMRRIMVRRVRVNYIELSCTGLVSSGIQVQLFYENGTDREKERSIVMVMDSIRMKYGFDAIGRGVNHCFRGHKS